MADDATKRFLIDNIDDETRRWLHDYCTWKRRKVASPGELSISFLKSYMDARLYDYYFIQRNYSTLVPLLDAYKQSHGEVDGVTALIGDLAPTIHGRA
ncbi:hypothetical protein [Fundidesulfovibrio magnetotacticus]|nr:hypothetical protein [Fundidesulfovibrio magnetotacticus]